MTLTLICLAVYVAGLLSGVVLIALMTGSGRDSRVEEAMETADYWRGEYEKLKERSEDAA